jgi:hypothetical protein
MDVDHMSSIRVDKDNNRERWVAFNRATGARMSAMEHLVPEEMYSTEDNPAHGISAVKALRLAAAEGQKIWTITQSNLSQAMAALNLSSSVEADIRNAVRAGKEVTAHEDTINFHGRPSAGYMVIDPETGAGGYLIAGGENGGVLQFTFVFAVFVIAFFISAVLLFSSGWLILAGIASIVWNMLNFRSWIDGINESNSHKEFSANNFAALGGLILGLLASSASGASAAALWFGDFMAYFLGMI